MKIIKIKKISKIILKSSESLKFILIDLKVVSFIKATTKTVIAANIDEVEIEAPYIYKNGEYYYLFVNHGKCCNGINSTYFIVAGRSKNIGGPYFDKNGKDMLNGGGSVILKTEGRYIGPGHAGILTTSEYGDIFTYHFYDGFDNGISKLGVRSLSWNSEGWPILGGHLVDQK